MLGDSRSNSRPHRFDILLTWYCSWKSLHFTEHLLHNQSPHHLEPQDSAPHNQFNLSKTRRPNLLFLVRRRLTQSSSGGNNCSAELVHYCHVAGNGRLERVEAKDDAPARSLLAETADRAGEHMSAILGRRHAYGNPLPFPGFPPWF